ncbi:MAG: L-aspartate oxidase [Acidimicrobiia bacterium]
MLDLLVVGSGVAGLSAAVHAAETGATVALATKGDLVHGATRYAQGGVAAALMADDDSPELHLSDTLAAGAGLCDTDAVRVLVTDGPARVRELMTLGAVFDRTGDGGAAALALAREGGHSVARVVHAGGDATGAEIERALVAAVRATACDVREGQRTLDLIVEGGACAGVRGIDAGGQETEIRARHVLLATGGVGQLFSVTTNPPESTGDGTAMARRAGVAVADVEFMQFHPTALHTATMPRPLLSEALRGEGAVLRDEAGVAFMADEHPLADLAPRDIVARAIAMRLRDRGLAHLWLDATDIDGFPVRFPTIFAAVRRVGLDPGHDWLPVAPAAHYLSGGICTDLDGATTLPGLWACGEVACSGVHGANRLASNSLLDGLVFARRAVAAISRGKHEPDATGVLRGIDHVSFDVGTGAVTPRSRRSTGGSESGTSRADVQEVMTRDAGVLRDEASLAEAADRLAQLMPGASDPEVRNLVEVGAGLVAAAAARHESRGTHTRLDYPDQAAWFLGRFVFTAESSPHFVPLPAPAEARRR